jgi:hypothetical protein
MVYTAPIANTAARSKAISNPSPLPPPAAVELAFAPPFDFERIFAINGNFIFSAPDSIP